VATKDLIEAGFENVKVKSAVFINARRFVIDREVGLLKCMEPNATLFGRERNLRTWIAGMDSLFALWPNATHPLIEQAQLGP
jgi:hypothetical protein